jgi:hypothetical protein
MCFADGVRPQRNKFDDFKKAIFEFFENIKDFEIELQTFISCNFDIAETEPINLSYKKSK